MLTKTTLTALLGLLITSSAVGAIAPHPGPLAAVGVDAPDGIQLFWTPTADAVAGGSYRIYRAVDEAPSSLLTETSTTQYTDADVSDGHVYHYSITSVSPTGESEPTSISIERMTLGAGDGGACIAISSSGHVAVYMDNCLSPRVL